MSFQRRKVLQRNGVVIVREFPGIPFSEDPAAVSHRWHDTAK